MANFIVKDSFQDARAGLVAARPDSLQRHRRHVQSARFQHHRHDREPGERQQLPRGVRPSPSEQIRQLLQRKAKAQAQASNVLGSELLVNSGPASKRLDIVIMVRTLRVVLTGRGAV